MRKKCLVKKRNSKYPSDAKKKYYAQIRSMTWLLMFWLLAYPCHDICRPGNGFMQNKCVLVFHLWGFLIPTPSPFWEMIENANTLSFLKMNSARHGLIYKYAWHEILHLQRQSTRPVHNGTEWSPGKDELKGTICVFLSVSFFVINQYCYLSARWCNTHGMDSIELKQATRKPKLKTVNWKPKIPSLSLIYYLFTDWMNW